MSYLEIRITFLPSRKLTSAEIVQTLFSWSVICKLVCCPLQRCKKFFNSVIYTVRLLYYYLVSLFDPNSFTSLKGFPFRLPLNIFFFVSLKPHLRPKIMDLWRVEFSAEPSNQFTWYRQQFFLMKLILWLNWKFTDYLFDVVAPNRTLNAWMSILVNPLERG